ncbi:MAG: hypothetical protein CR986_00170 [Ignavibacteriae bacterium]|nr:MAG: hypothetical protein CR986_00170 [Ignavibacteriota bacterium]
MKKFKFKIFEGTQSKKLENAIFVSVVLFIFKIIIPLNTNTFYLFINEVLIILSIFVWGNYVSEFVKYKLNKPLNLVINSILLNALILFIISVTSWLFSESEKSITSSNLVYLLFSITIVFLLIGSLTYVFSVYRGLCYHRQKKDPSLYFNMMIIFVIITSLYLSFIEPKNFIPNIYNNSEGYLLTVDKNSGSIVYYTLYFITVVLLIINSFRVAWIAFINKKQKIALIFISMIIMILSWVNFAIIEAKDILRLSNFSPALEQLLIFLMLYGAIYFTIIFFTTIFHIPTAEAIDRKTQELTSVMDISRLMNQVFDFEELSETITDTTINVSNSDAAWLAIGKNNKTDFYALKGIELNEANTITEFLVRNNLLSEKEVKVTELSLFEDKHQLSQSFKSIVSAPLTAQNTKEGFLFAGRKSNRIFEDEDSKSVETFARFAGMALENAKLLEESIEKERLEKEWDLAREVQYKILPQKNPEYKNIELTSLFIPAFEVGGDYFDFFSIDDKKLGVVIADVSGKGIEAAFIMAEIKGIFASLSKLYAEPKELLIMANSILENSIARKRFVTAIYGILDIEKKIFKFARAGHSPLFFCRNNKVERIIPQGIGLGLDYSEKFKATLKEMEIELKNNDIITLFTDGINESQNENLEEFGYNRLEQIISENSDSDVEELSSKIMREVTTFTKNSSQHDDITMVLLKWKDHNNFNGES